MNCFQIIIFVSPETTRLVKYLNKILLWIAFKLLFLCRQKQHISLTNENKIVVNCFQIIIFVSPETTFRQQRTAALMLWIAFKLLFLCRQKQLRCNNKRCEVSCELLSNYYFCVARNNEQKMIVRSIVLWIAFKLLFLCRQKQHDTRKSTQSISCELLSNYYFCVARNNCKPR